MLKPFIPAVLLFLSAISLYAQLTDIDGNTYRTIEIGSQVWTVENLRVSRFRNGDTIPHAVNFNEWEEITKKQRPGSCVFADKLKNEKEFGRLYNWFTVDDERNIAPEGWHVPTYAEWEELKKYLMENKSDGDDLKTTFGWKENSNGTDEYGFSAFPAGCRDNNGYNKGLGEYVSWWSMAGFGGSGIIFMLKYDSKSLTELHARKTSGRYIRLIKD